MVGFECVAGGDQVHNRVGQTHQRCEFHAAIQLDEVDVNAFGGKKLPRYRHVLGGHLQARALLDGRGVVKIGTHRHADAAFGDVQVEGLVQAVAAMLQQGVLAGDAQVGTAVLHISGYIGGAHHQHAYTGLVGGENQLARFFRVVQHLNAGCAQQRQGFFKDAAFG